MLVYWSHMGLEIMTPSRGLTFASYDFNACGLRDKTFLRTLRSSLLSQKDLKFRLLSLSGTLCEDYRQDKLNGEKWNFRIQRSSCLSGPAASGENSSWWGIEGKSLGPIRPKKTGIEPKNKYIKHA